MSAQAEGGLRAETLVQKAPRCVQVPLYQLSYCFRNTNQGFTVSLSRRGAWRVWVLYSPHPDALPKTSSSSQSTPSHLPYTPDSSCWEMPPELCTSCTLPLPSPVPSTWMPSPCPCPNSLPSDHCPAHFCLAVAISSLSHLPRGPEAGVQASPHSEVSVLNK